MTSDTDENYYIDTKRDINDLIQTILLYSTVSTSSQTLMESTAVIGPSTCRATIAAMLWI